MQVTTGRGGIRNQILLKVSAIAGALVIIASSVILFFYRSYEISDLVVMTKREAKAVISVGTNNMPSKAAAELIISKAPKEGKISIVAYSAEGIVQHSIGGPLSHETHPPMPIDNHDQSTSIIKWDGRSFAVAATDTAFSDGNRIYAFSDITENISSINERATKMALAAIFAEAVLFGVLIVVAGLGDRKLVESEKEQMAMESELFFLAHYDTLTHLPNRTLFWERADAAITRASRLGKAVSVMSFDMEGFGAINDDMGRGAGDRILMETALRIQASCRNSDLVCRTGPDEFTVIMEDLDSDRAFEGIERLRIQIEKSMEPEFSDIVGSIKIKLYGGAAAFPFHGSNSEEIFARAHSAMAKARDGDIHFAVYSQ